MVKTLSTAVPGVQSSQDNAVEAQTNVGGRGRANGGTPCLRPSASRHVSLVDGSNPGYGCRMTTGRRIASITITVALGLGLTVRTSAGRDD
jgi:hypothetical protein